MALQQVNKVHEEFRFTEKLSVADKTIYFNMGLLSENENNYRMAVEHYKKDIQLDPHAGNSISTILGTSFRSKKLYTSTICKANLSWYIFNRIGLYSPKF